MDLPNNLRLPTQDSATGRGLKTTLFSTASGLIIFSTGLFGVLHSVPGCSDAVLEYIRANALTFSLSIGVPTGVFSFVWNYLRPQVRNY